MAEIEFKRRGTPVWAVLLVLLVVAGILYGVFARRSSQPAPAVTDTLTTPTGPAAAPAPSAATPAPAVSPVDAYAAWADTAKMPTGATPAAHYVATGLRLLVPALKDRAPMAGVQHLMVAAMADTLDMPNLTEAKQTDVAQAAFFAIGYATRSTPTGGALDKAATRVQLKTPLASQRPAIEHFFKTAAQVWRGPAPVPAAKP